ncbi:hypothetical protein POM88_024470 [Heracleum sosnowskyi]|uniref:F-box protein n=1 Tax=Heracleum sosnowskyi TaxID=360622 RepID=A0AAD8I355_9APIA|nr:hypothetical protein POM88_024466 [Heracleum sosnowskyi]KAK1377726.1 hypothetical protein POM88_024470 [Heracleum sosnowskyi]
MYLWNPATNLSKHIPSPSLSDDEEALGFGFDEIDNDFKIVRVVWRFKPTCYHKKYSRFHAEDCEEIYVDVYSSNQNIWRKLPGKPTDIPYLFNKFDVIVNT